jgi:hypothetical protein
MSGVAASTPEGRLAAFLKSFPEEFFLKSFPEEFS